MELGGLVLLLSSLIVTTAIEGFISNLESSLLFAAMTATVKPFSAILAAIFLG